MGDGMGKFAQVQIRRIEEDKWFEGIRLKRDPGSGYVLNWILSRALWFRNTWEQSLCKKCVNWHCCGHQIRQNCRHFKPEKIA